MDGKTWKQRNADAVNKRRRDLYASDPARAGWDEEAFIATDTEAQEAMLAFARSLSPADRRRLGR